MFVATINVPGYMPMDDEPPTFETAREAWWFLYHERTAEDWEHVDLPEDGHDHRAYTLCPVCSDVEDTETADELGRMAVRDETGTVIGDTPGYDGDHDLGLAYSVTEVE